MPPMISKLPHKSMKEMAKTHGTDNENILRVALKMCPDPYNIDLNMGDVAQFLHTNRDDPDVQQMLNYVKEATKKLDEERKNLSSINFSSLPILKKSAWVIQLQFLGVETLDGTRVDIRHSEASSRQDLVQKFTMTCYNRMGPGMNIPSPRILSEFVGLPNSKQVVDFIRQAFAKPYPPLEPCLPSLLVISSKLQQHEAAFKPFLDSLPKPFTWFVSPQSMEEQAEEFNRHRAQLSADKYMKLALENKAEGNKAFRAADGSAAIAAYQEAIRFVGKAQRTTDSAEKVDVMDNFVAICYANCSAARMLPGRSMDAIKALEDAKRAILYDENYAKGYVRLSKAHEALGEYSQAEEAIAKALRTPQLENHDGLIDQLIKLQTGGKGLPNEHDVFVEWTKRVFDEGESAERMRDVGGLWRRRCEAHKKRFDTSK